MPDDLQFVDFSSAIGYSDLPAGVDPKEGVLFDWTQWTSLPAAGPGWKLIYNGLQHRPPAACRKFDFRRDREELSLEVFVSSTGPQVARRHLLEIGTSTMMVTSPYMKGPADLGDLSIVPRSGLPDSIVWTYRNVCFHLEAQDSRLDVMAVAYDLQKQVAEHLIKNVSQYAPPVTSVTVRPETAAIGDVVTVQLHGPKTLDPGRVDIYFKIDGDGLVAHSQEGLILKFSAVKPGTTRIDIQAADKRTLLSAPSTTAVNIVQR